MIRTVKSARGSVADDGQPAVTATVQALLAQVEKGGDKAVRELSVRFDKFDRDDYRLTKAEIDGCIN
ncbi:MAG: histidinol dehydrogenase, partial [Mesorhizobium sp.]